LAGSKKKMCVPLDTFPSDILFDSHNDLYWNTVLNMLKSFYSEAGGRIIMKLKAKGHLESQKKITSDKLAARLSSLKEKGLADAAIQRDCVIKKMKADIRQTNYRLASIAAQEKSNAERAQAKAEKLAGKNKSPDKPSAKTAKGAPGKKEKKVKKKAQPPVSEELEKEKKEKVEMQPTASDEQEEEKKEKEKAQSPASDGQE
jgi:hypothetical protein